MESQIKDQNATIHRAMTDLKKIGYIDYTETKKGREIMSIIHTRSPKLGLATS